METWMPRNYISKYIQKNMTGELIKQKCLKIQFFYTKKAFLIFIIFN